MDNIAFLVNTGPDTIGSPTGPNAETALMTATFWIETIEYVITLPIFKPGNPLPRFPLGHDPLAPTFTVDPGREVTAARQIKLHTTQIQYSQIVNLNFNGLKWPHVSVATLVPAHPVTVPPGA